MNHELDVNILSAPDTSSPTIRDYSDIITGDIYLNASVSMGGHNWTVAHIDYTNKMFYLLDMIIESITIFGTLNAYVGSTLASVANDFEQSLPSLVTDRLLTMSISGVSSKVFVPTYKHYIGQFSIFTSNTIDPNRVAVYNGTPTAYWTSSTGGNGGFFIQSSGYVDSASMHSVNSNEHGFRPAVCLPF